MPRFCLILRRGRTRRVGYMHMQRTNTIWIAAVTLLCATSSPTLAQRPRVTQIPSTGFSCELCHLIQDDNSYDRLNLFGLDVQRTLIPPPNIPNPQLFLFLVDWSAVCPLDSDNDGYSNGIELGEPTCEWVRTDDPTTPLSDPYDPTSKPDIPLEAESTAGEGCSTTNKNASNISFWMILLTAHILLTSINRFGSKARHIVKHLRS